MTNSPIVIKRGIKSEVRMDHLKSGTVSLTDSAHITDSL